MFDISIIFFTFWFLLHILFEPFITLVKCIKWIFAPLPEVICDKNYSKELNNLFCEKVEIQKGYNFIEGYLDYHNNQYRVILGKYPNCRFLYFTDKDVINVFRNHIELG